MTPRTIWILFMALALAVATPTVGLAVVKPDPTADHRQISVLLSEMQLQTDRLLIDREALLIHRDVDWELRALKRIHELLGEDEKIDLDAWNIGTDRWEIRKISYRHSFLDWNFEVPIVELEQATPTQVTINGEIYLWEPDHFQKLRWYRLEQWCIANLYGHTGTPWPEPNSPLNLHRVEFSKRCRLIEDDD